MTNDGPEKENIKNRDWSLGFCFLVPNGVSALVLCGFHMESVKNSKAGGKHNTNKS